MLSYYQPIPDSNYYTVTFRSDSSGRPASSRADAERVNDFTLTLRLPCEFYIWEILWLELYMTTTAMRSLNVVATVKWWCICY